MNETMIVWFSLGMYSLVGVSIGAILAFLAKLIKIHKENIKLSKKMVMVISNLRLLPSFVVLSMLIPTISVFVIGIKTMATINQYINVCLLITLISGLCKFLLAYKWELYIKEN